MADRPTPSGEVRRNRGNHGIVNVCGHDEAVIYILTASNALRLFPLAYCPHTIVPAIPRLERTLGTMATGFQPFHGTANGLLGLGALIQLCATLPDNFIAFEYTTGDPEWWYDIVEGLPDPIVVDGKIAVSDRPGMGVDLIPEKARLYLEPQDQGFFD